MNNERVLQDDWSLINSLLPNGWREKAKELGALLRFRRFRSVDDLLKALLVHLVDGCSGRETALRIEELGIASISDVAFLKRLEKAECWLRWMSEQVMKKAVGQGSDVLQTSHLLYRVVDASNVKGPGKTSQSCRLHYALELPNLQCDEIKITDQKTGESFCNFTIKPGDLIMGDRGYAHARGVAHVVKNGGHVLVRTNLKLLSLRQEDGSNFPILSKAELLKDNEIGDWDVWIHYEYRKIKGRLCVIRKDPAARERARKKALRLRQKGHGKKGKIREDTLKASEYIFIFTTLDRTFTAGQVLEIYRSRWQVELVFKRLKSIIKIGNLHNKKPATARAWLHGKLLVAFMTEALIGKADSFSPSGGVTSRFGRQTQFMEGDQICFQMPKASVTGAFAA